MEGFNFVLKMRLPHHHQRLRLPQVTINRALILTVIFVLSLCGFALFISKTNVQLGVGESIVYEANLFNLPDENVPRITGDIDEIGQQLERLVTDRLCMGNNLTCAFEQRHLPPFVLALPNQDAVERLRQLCQSTVLVITFNRRTAYYTSPIVHLLYRRIFAEILYCGPSSNVSRYKTGVEEIFHDKKIVDYFGDLYLGYQTENPHIDGYGENNYFCFNLALDRLKAKRPGLDVKGVFVLADDAIFSYWNVIFDDKMFNLSNSHSLRPHDHVYNTETLNECDLASEPSTCETPNSWLNWPNNYKIPTSNFYHELVEHARANSLYSRCLARLSSRTKGLYRVTTGFADMFYVSRRNFDEATAMFELASRHKVFQEIAVPTVFGSFDQATVGVIDDSGDDTNSVSYNRLPPWKAFDARRLLMHPFKMSSLVQALSGNEEARKSHTLDICLSCMLAQYSKLLSLLNSEADKTYLTISYNK